MVEGFLAENVQNLQFLSIQLAGTVCNVSSFLEVLLFYALGIFETDLNNILKQFLYF
mgnify:CR=1 FL=1